jgi:nucleoside diphosphate kinase
MTLKENNFIGVIIKPDAFCDSIQGQITTDILKNNFKIRFAKTMQIDSRQVMYVYPDKIHTDRFPYSHYSITHGISRLLLLEKENAYEDFMRIKSNCIGEL